MARQSFRSIGSSRGSIIGGISNNVIAVRVQKDASMPDCVLKLCLGPTTHHIKLILRVWSQTPILDTRNPRTIDTLAMKPLNLLCFLFLATQINAAIWREVSIPTRVAAPKSTLFADVYSNDTVTAKPVILIQTPYNKIFYRISLNSVLNTTGASVPYDSAHYNYVIVDWRGFYTNKAAAQTPYDRGLDGYDIVEWIAQQPWCNGKVGTWGGSALGMIQFQTAAQHPPHLVCAAPFIKDFATKYEDYYYGGVYRKEHVESLEKLGFAVPSTVLAHPTHDATWKIVESQSDASKYAVPMFLCSGWFDHFPDDVLRAFSDLRLSSDQSVRSRHKLMFGPFEHSNVGQEQQGVLNFPDVEGLPTRLGMQFFDHYLRGLDNGWDALPTVQYYQMGDNVWKTDNSWPPSDLRTDTLFFHAAHIMDKVDPSNDKSLVPPDTVYGDPRNPVPTIGGSRFNPSDKNMLTGPQDIASLLSRQDQWTYRSDVLSSKLVLRGSSKLQLKVSCSTKDADICARLCDVYPDGRWIILTQATQRLRLRNTLDAEELLPLNTVQDVTVQFQNMANTFLAGHRVGILLSASDYPMFDLNLNNGGAMYTAGDTLSTSIMIWHGYQQASSYVYQTPSTGTSVEEDCLIERQELDVRPNPTQDVAVLRFELPESDIASVVCYDQLGREVHTIHGVDHVAAQEGLVIATEGLRSGLVHVVVRSNSGIRSCRLHLLR